MNKQFRKILARAWLGMAAASVLLAQKPLPKAFQAQAPSMVSLSARDGSQTVEISNVLYEVTSDNVPGWTGQRLLLRQTQRSKQVLDEIGMEAETTLEAWLLGSDLRQKPLYAIKASGVGGRTLDGALFVANRQLEEAEWWSVYKLGTGERLFDTSVPVESFSISREELILRYAGFEAPSDDASDARLRDGRVVGVLFYSTAERVKREALLTCDDPKQAKLLRSYSDTTRTISIDQGSPLRVRVSFSQNFPSAANTLVVVVPILRDDLDLAHAEAPARLHVSAWRR